MIKSKESRSNDLRAELLIQENKALQLDKRALVDRIADLYQELESTRVKGDSYELKVTNLEDSLLIEKKKATDLEESLHKSITEFEVLKTIYSDQKLQ